MFTETLPTSHHIYKYVRVSNKLITIMVMVNDVHETLPTSHHIYKYVRVSNKLITIMVMVNDVHGNTTHISPHI